MGHYAFIRHPSGHSTLREILCVCRPSQVMGCAKDIGRLYGPVWENLTHDQLQSLTNSALGIEAAQDVCTMTYKIVPYELGDVL